jgi:serine/threonine-protein kinase
VLLRLDGTGAPVVVAEAEADIGPIAVGSNGDVYFSTETQIFRLSAGGGPPVLVTGTSARLGRPHGLAVAGDGALLVSDTDNNRLLRIDAATGAVTTLAQVGTPDGIDVATDGTIYVVDARSKRVVHLSATGEPLGFAGPAFANPYDVEVGPGGVVYVVDTAVSGRVLRVAPDGTVTTLSHRP